MLITIARTHTVLDYRTAIKEAEKCLNVKMCECIRTEFIHWINRFSW